MASNITANTTHPANSQIILRKGTGGTPLSHDEVDGNFITLMDGHNDVVTALGTKAASSHTHSSATASSAGFMSTSDKSKLDGIASSANNYSLPNATSSVLGGVKVGTGISVSSGTISVSDATTSASGLMSSTDKSKLNGIASSANNYSLPTASSSVLGGIKVGSNLSISNGVLSANTQSGTYSLPTATSSTLGGVKIGNGINISSGVISVKSNDTALNVASTGLTLDKASASGFGIVKIGSGINVSNGEISVTSSSYSLPTASATQLGGVKVGSGLSISNGVLSATATSPSNLSNTHLSLLNTASTGGADIEIGGAEYAFIDLKNPQSDDYDLRIISQSTFDPVVHNSLVRLESSGKLGFVAGAKPSESAPGNEVCTMMDRTKTSGLKSQADGSGGFTSQWVDGENGISTRFGGDDSNYSTNVIDATTINFPTAEIEWNPHFMVRGDARFLRNGAKNMPLAVFEGTSGDAEAAIVLANSETGSSRGTVMIHTCESFDHVGSSWFNFGNQAHLGKATWGYVLANAAGDSHGVEVNQTDGAFTPIPDNKTNLGSSSTRWKQLFAGTTSISTSDINLKTEIVDLNEAEKRVAVACKGLVKKFKFKDAVAEKGDKARFHVGVIAQQVEQAFIDEGLNGWDYGILCKDDSWSGKAKPTGSNPMGAELNLDHEPTDNDLELVDADGFTKSTKYSVRYEELFAFIISAL